MEMFVLSRVSHVQLDPRLLCPWDSPGKNTGVGSHFLLQGISLTQGPNLCLLMSSALAGGFFTASTTWEGGDEQSVKFNPCG